MIPPISPLIPVISTRVAIVVPFGVAIPGDVNVSVRVGCGRYDWWFGPDDQCLVDKLIITVEHMVTLERDSLAPVMEWLSALPYPWCPARTAVDSAPRVDGLAVILRFIDQGPAAMTL